MRAVIVVLLIVVIILLITCIFCAVILAGKADAKAEQLQNDSRNSEADDKPST